MDGPATQNEPSPWKAVPSGDPTRFAPGVFPQIDGMPASEPVPVKAPLVVRLLVLLLIAALALAVGAAVKAFLRDTSAVRTAKRAPPPPSFVLRPEPARFPAKSCMPNAPEGVTSGSVDMGTFSAGRDLVYVQDARVWWESDQDENDDEDDHSMNVAIEAPLRRLIDLVSKEGGTLRVQDAYRPSGIHSARSLHREGRALDLTCEELGLERLAKLCWRAGFDWVFFEAGTKGGDHVHVSVKRAGTTGTVRTPGADSMPSPAASAADNTD